MSNKSDRLTAQELWDEASSEYLEGRVAPGSLDYGPLCPLENELNLLPELVGEIDGLRVLDAGCGGGDNAVWLAQQGAQVTALDFSEPQLSHARRTARRADVTIDFVSDAVESLTEIADATQDLILCTHVLAYVENIDGVLAAFARVLRPGGFLIASVEHPVRACFYEDRTSDLTSYPEQCYFDTGLRRYTFIRECTEMRSYHRTLEQWVSAINGSALRLNRLLEPHTPDDILDEFFPEDGPQASLRNIPHTLILVARKPLSEPGEN